MPRISTDAEITAIRMKERASAPDTPASGYGQLYLKDDGKFYFKNDAGTEACLSDVIDKMTNPMTTAGDIIYGGTDGLPTRLAKGTEDHVLTMGTTNPTWAAASGASGLAVNGWEAADAMTYASADDPTFTVTITGDQSAKYSVGMRIKLTQSTGGTKYFVITKIAVSGDTTLTLYGGTEYNLEDEAISNPYYSVVKAPQGFPTDPNKWTVSLTDTTSSSQASPTQNVWYNVGSLSLSIPIGVWKVDYQACLYAERSSAGWVTCQSTLSTANNSESDVDFTTYVGANAVVTLIQTVHRSKDLVLISKTAYYINIRTIVTSGTDIELLNGNSKFVLRAVCAYL